MIMFLYVTEVVSLERRNISNVLKQFALKIISKITLTSNRHFAFRLSVVSWKRYLEFSLEYLHVYVRTYGF